MKNIDPFYTPIFSLLMANYNNALYIKESIESVLNQSYTNWELIIVDDCSTDNSLEVINKYLLDKRIKLILNKKNLGVGATKRICMKNATGEIIGILDSDDAIHEEYMSMLIKCHQENHNKGVIYFPHFECDSKLNIKQVADYVSDVKDKRTMLEKSRINGFITIKKNAYEKTQGFDAQFKKAVDQDIIYKLEEVTELFFLDKPLYYYRMHPKGISQGNNVVEANTYDILAKLYAYRRRKSTKIGNISRKEIANQLGDAIFLCLKKFKFKRAIGFLYNLILLMKYKDINLKIFKTIFLSAVKKIKKLFR